MASAEVVLIMGLCMMVSGRRPTYSLTCHSNEDCTAPGTQCYLDYVGCHSGLCGCKYGEGKDGSCILRDKGDSCQSRDECPQGLDCHMGLCACTGRMIDNNHYCLKDFERLAGDQCGSGHLCLHKKEDSVDYTTNDVSCVDGYCACRRGLRLHGKTCRRHRPDEYGCVTNPDCSGDSVCENHICTCPLGHKEVTSGKCGKINARTGIGVGQTCDEIIVKDKFCADGLECIRCGEDFGFKCREYKSSRPEAVGSTGMHLQATAALLITLVLISNTFSSFHLL